MYAWHHSDRLRPLRMVWFKANNRSPLYVLRRFARPRLKAQAPPKALTRIEWDRSMRRAYPGR
jgi:hypothetical protein